VYLGELDAAAGNTVFMALEDTGVPIEAARAKEKKAVSEFGSLDRDSSDQRVLSFSVNLGTIL